MTTQHGSIERRAIIAKWLRERLATGAVECALINAEGEKLGYTMLELSSVFNRDMGGANIVPRKWALSPDAPDAPSAGAIVATRTATRQPGGPLRSTEIIKRREERAGLPN
jgi:hypothetical protein